MMAGSINIVTSCIAQFQINNIVIFYMKPDDHGVPDDL